ncbi:hypothetical protein NA57DRAFT_56677 [Rhizodiscina lignyota]|uniref:Uncharacterized protein n=1 Tax=Rhizodiscina lignyota TaxID=1504668 RepID=A0A9P4IIG5_9PEZI|nr:hypothetical protein NA57DRAFT_56677 [Rhizodiscina lignyota]
MGGSLSTTGWISSKKLLSLHWRDLTLEGWDSKSTILTVSKLYDTDCGNEVKHLTIKQKTIALPFQPLRGQGILGHLPFFREAYKYTRFEQSLDGSTFHGDERVFNYPYTDRDVIPAFALFRMPSLESLHIVLAGHETVESACDHSLYGTRFGWVASLVLRVACRAMRSFHEPNHSCCKLEEIELRNTYLETHLIFVFLSKSCALRKFKWTVTADSGWNPAEYSVNVLALFNAVTNRRIDKAIDSVELDIDPKYIRS